MTSALQAEPNQLIDSVAEKLKDKEEIESPEWAEYVKTGPNKERPPEQKEWWYQRCSSLLRKLYKKGPLGVERLRSSYGGKRRRGHQTEHFWKASGKVIRTALQQLEEEELLEKTDNGRKVTAKGQSLLDNTAAELEG